MSSTPFSFEEALWLSVHTFSTVGYGSIYPVCLGGHFFVVFESFVSLLITATMGGAIFFEVSTLITLIALIALRWSTSSTF